VRTAEVILAAGAIIAVLLFAYLLVALLAPEKFQ
jgi:K+-transporting ATPase KdpF subunit